MRKLSKILTVLLTMTMLFSAMAIFSFADSAAQTNLLESPYATKVLNAENFESAKIGAYSPSLNSAAKGFNNTTAGTVTLAIEQQTNSEGATNKYLTFTHSKSDTQKYIDMTTGDKASAYDKDSIYSSSSYDYMVLDYDFTSMEYLYEIDGYTFHGKNPPENAENVRLAYWDKFKMTSSYRCDGSSKYASPVAVFILLDKDTNEWYASTDATLEKSTDVKLSNKLGEWNHITLVCKVIKENGVLDKSFFAFYINGQFFGENSFSAGSSKSSTNFHADCVRIWFNTDDSNGGSRDYYSVSFDNIASYYYKTGYTSGDDIYGIDDFLNDDYKAKNITSAMDIVYNEDYYYTGTENLSSASIVYADNTTRAIPNVKKLVPFLKDNANVTLNVSLFDFDLPVSSGIETVTLKTSRPDLSVTLSAATRENYKLYHNGDTYVIKLKDAEDGMKIKWLKDVDANTVFEEGFLLPYALPNLDKFDNYHVLDMEKGTLEVIEFWTVSIPGTKYDGVMPEDFYLTPAEICELKEIYGIDTVYLKPHYQTINLKYAITTSEIIDDEEIISLYAPDFNFNKFGNIESLIDAIKKAPNGATLTLFEDLTLDSTVELEAKTLNINLNGKTVTSSQSIMFGLNEGATLNVFGGGKINAIIFAAVADGVDECALNILGVKDGDDTIYIDFSVATLVKAVGPLTVIGQPFKDQTDSKKINVNIEGGKFAISSTLTDVAAPDVRVNIDNATIILENDNSSVFAEAVPVTGQRYYTAGYKVTVKNTAIVTKSDAHVFSIDSDWINAYFENTKVIAKTYDLTRATTVNITLGKDNVFAGDIKAYEAKLKFSDGVEYEINSDDTNVLTVDEFSGVISLTTFVEEAEDDQTPPVNATASVENNNAESNVAKSTTPNSTYCLAEHIEKNKEKALPKSLSAASKENEEEK